MFVPETRSQKGISEEGDSVKLSYKDLFILEQEKIKTSQEGLSSGHVEEPFIKTLSHKVIF